MNILFLTIVNLNSLDGNGIYQDVINELIDQGNKLFIASPIERKFKKKTHLIKRENYEILKIRTLNLVKTNSIEKGLGQLLMEYQFKKAIKKYWGKIKFDLVIYSTPPITFNNVIEMIKIKNMAKSYLMLKDIFPQNAVDLNMMKENSFIHKFFRKKERKLYEISDKIGCMSPANLNYVKKHNPEVLNHKLELCPNAFKIKTIDPISVQDRKLLQKQLEIPENKIISIYGGNLGKPQGVDFLIEILKQNEDLTNSFIVIVGSGTEYNKIKQWFLSNQPKNAKLLPSLPKKDYDHLIKIADIGLIFLDHRFTIPNFPSRFLNYLENSLPVMIASDPNTDIGLIAEKEGIGFWCESNDVEEYMVRFKKLLKDKDLRLEMGKKARILFERDYSAKKVADNLLKFAQS